MGIETESSKHVAYDGVLQLHVCREKQGIQ